MTLLRWSRSVSVILLGAAALWSGCSDDAGRSLDPPIPVAKPRGDAAESHGASGAASGAKVLKSGPFEKSFDGIQFSVPKGWEEIELAPQQQGFIDARFQISTPDGVVTVTCSSNAGGVDSNVQRWITQFRMAPGDKPMVETIDIDGKPATWVDLHGEFTPGPMSASASSAAPIERMLGVAIPLGARDFYLKLTGTNAAVNLVRATFREFARSGRFVGKSG